MIALKLNDSTTRVWFSKGSYEVYFVGGYYARPGSIFRLEVLNSSTNETIVPHENFFKIRTWIRGIRAVDFYDLVIDSEGTYEISIANYDDIEVKRSMLFSMRLFQNALPVKDIAIVIKGSYQASCRILP